MNVVFGNILKDRRLWTIIIVIFVVFIAIFDENNLFKRREVNQQIRDLKVQKDYYKKQIQQDSTIIQNLKNDKFLEKFARENFFMKRDSDIVYIIK